MMKLQDPADATQTRAVRTRTLPNRKSPAAPPVRLTMAANFANATSLALVSVDASGAIRFVNQAAAEMFGYGIEDMIGEPVEIIIPERFRQAHGRGFARAMAGETLNTGGRSVEVHACRRDGSEFPIELTLCAWQDQGEAGAGAVIKDITERREHEARLLRLACRDVLTGLRNRNGFADALSQSLLQGNSLAVVMLDLDGFREINDTHGHAIGDALLQAVAIRLSRVLPDRTVLARFGADEYVVLAENIEGPRDGHLLASTLRQAFAHPFDIGGHVLYVGASIGFSLGPGHGIDADELIASADFALSRARTDGGGAIIAYDPAMMDEAAARRATRDELRVALRNGELVLHYQPQVNMVSGETIGFEALIRWNHPQRGLITPGAFLPVLDQSALAIEIGWWTLDQACRDTARLKVAGFSGIKMGINLFPGQLHSPHLGRKVTDALALHGLEASDIELEITETTALRDDDKSLEAMRQLRDIGVGVAFDDFGTGYASLVSLQRYPLTTLKIDRAFVCNLSSRPGDVAIVRALIGMSRDLGLETIAEGIETQEQDELLRMLGCHVAQGYRYGKPMPIDLILTQTAGTSGDLATG